MDDHKQCPSDNGKEYNNCCSVILELSENDPLFDQKKKLLGSKGFSPKEQINISCYLSPDQKATTLNEMLQISRIIHLDEAELYFGEIAVNSQAEIYSPRNELEAFNSVVSLLDVSLSNGTNEQINVLRDLQNAVRDMIHDFRDDNRMTTTVLENYNCEKEKFLLQWGENNGVRTKLQIAYVEGAGRGAIAKDDLEVGDIALEIPTSIIISEELVHESDMYHILKEIDGITSETMLLLWSMKEKHDCDSKFKIYFATLPTDFNTGLSFGFEAILALDDTLLLEEILQARQHLHDQYDELFPVLYTEHPKVFPPELYTWEQFLWACELWYSNSMKILFPDGKLRTCLIPIAGFLNHSLYPHITHYGRVDSATNTLKFPLSRQCSVGEQCFLSYGNLSTSHLITFYGFSTQGNNLYDVIPLDFDFDEAASTDSCPLPRNHMVRYTWFSKNHEIFYYGLPPPLLDYLRETLSPKQHTKTLDRENLELEMEVLNNLISTFDDMMKKLEHTDASHRQNSNWDVKLALKFKDIQRTIVSSVLTSCYSGIKLVVEDKIAQLLD